MTTTGELNSPLPHIPPPTTGIQTALIMEPLYLHNQQKKDLYSVVLCRNITSLPTQQCASTGKKQNLYRWWWWWWCVCMHERMCVHMFVCSYPPIHILYFMRTGKVTGRNESKDVYPLSSLPHDICKLSIKK